MNNTAASAFVLSLILLFFVPKLAFSDAPAEVPHSTNQSQPNQTVEQASLAVMAAQPTPTATVLVASMPSLLPTVTPTRAATVAPALAPVATPTVVDALADCPRSRRRSR